MKLIGLTLVPHPYVASSDSQARWYREPCPYLEERIRQPTTSSASPRLLLVAVTYLAEHLRHSPCDDDQPVRTAAFSRED